MVGFSVTSGAAFAVGSTAKTILNLIAGSSNPPVITEFGISFDSTSVGSPVLLELCTSTQGAAGTPGTIGTVKMVRGYPSYSPVTTAAGQYSAEPTTLTPVKQWLIQPYGGLLVIQYPLGREVQGQITAATDSKGLAWRVSIPAGATNARAYIEWEE